MSSKNVWNPLQQITFSLRCSYQPSLGLFPSNAGLCTYFFPFKDPCFLCQNLKHAWIKTIKYTYLQYPKRNLEFYTRNLFEVKIGFSHMDCKLDWAPPSQFRTLPLHQSFAISTAGIYLTCSLYEFSSYKQRKEWSRHSPFSSPWNWHLVGILD